MATTTKEIDQLFEKLKTAMEKAEVDGREELNAEGVAICNAIDMMGRQLDVERGSAYRAMLEANAAFYAEKGPEGADLAAKLRTLSACDARMWDFDAKYREAKLIRPVTVKELEPYAVQQVIGAILRGMAGVTLDGNTQLRQENEALKKQIAELTRQVP